MNLEIQSLRRAEAATLRLRGLYESYGYRKYRMGRFEEYSLYAANKSFLLGEKCCRIYGSGRTLDGSQAGRDAEHREEHQGR